MADVAALVGSGVPVCGGVGVGLPVWETSASVDVPVECDPEAIWGNILTFNTSEASTLM